MACIMRAHIICRITRRMKCICCLRGCMSDVSVNKPTILAGNEPSNLGQLPSYCFFIWVHELRYCLVERLRSLGLVGTLSCATVESYNGQSGSSSESEYSKHSSFDFWHHWVLHRISSHWLVGPSNEWTQWCLFLYEILVQVPLSTLGSCASHPMKIICLL